jgi:alpha-1,3-fucosyltransferase
LFESRYNYNLSTRIEPEKLTCDPIDKSKLAENVGVEIDGRVYPSRQALSFNTSINYKCLRQTSTTKRILVWKRFFGSKSIREDPDLLKKSNCPVTNCVITHDRSKLRKSDMVYVHVVQTPIGRDSLPKSKPRSQRWIFSAYESPLHTPLIPEYNSYFNLSSTYSLQSDFPNFYRNGFDQRFVWRTNGSFNKSFDYSEGKKMVAYAIISNCEDKSERMNYIKELKRYVSVNVFGSCGQPCPIDFDCREYFSAYFKFYLAFENSICSEYITEKFFDVLKYNVVPVVLGGGDYALHVILILPFKKSLLCISLIFFLNRSQNQDTLMCSITRLSRIWLAIWNISIKTLPLTISILNGKSLYQ